MFFKKVINQYTASISSATNFAFYPLLSGELFDFDFQDPIGFLVNTAGSLFLTALTSSLATAFIVTITLALFMSTPVVLAADALSSCVNHSIC